MILEALEQKPLSSSRGRWASLLAGLIITAGLVWIMGRLALVDGSVDLPLRLHSVKLETNLRDPSAGAASTPQAQRPDRSAHEEAASPEAPPALAVRPEPTSSLRMALSDLAAGLAARPLTAKPGISLLPPDPLPEDIRTDLAAMAPMKPVADLLNREGFQRLESRIFPSADRLMIDYDDVTDMELLMQLAPGGRFDVAWCNVIWTSAPSSLAREVAADTISQIEKWRLPLPEDELSDLTGRHLMIKVRRQAGTEPRLLDVVLVAG